MTNPLPKSPKSMSFGAKFAVIVGIVVALCVAYGQKSRAETLAVPNAAAARFSVEVTGSGPDVILIPGLGCSRDVWTDTVAHLKSRYRLHVINLAGFAGEPAGANAQLSDKSDILPAITEALDGYITTHKLQKPVIVGHSLGGLLAMMQSKAHPQSLSKAVIVDAFPFIGVMFDPSSNPEKLKPQAMAMKTRIESTPAEAFAAGQAQTAAGMVTSPEDQKKVAAWTVASDRHVFAQAFYEDMMTDLRGDLATIKTPYVVIAPHDDASPYSFVQTKAFYTMLYRDHQNTKVIGIDHAKHFVMLDQKEAFLKAIDEALMP